MILFRKLKQVIWANQNPGTTWAEASAGLHPYHVANVKSDMTRGMVTTSRTKVTGTNDYFYTTIIFDDKNRVKQTRSTNIIGGRDCQWPHQCHAPNRIKNKYEQRN